MARFRDLPAGLLLTRPSPGGRGSSHGLSLREDDGNHPRCSLCDNGGRFPDRGARMPCPDRLLAERAPARGKSFLAALHGIGSGSSRGAPGGWATIAPSHGKGERAGGDSTTRGAPAPDWRRTCRSPSSARAAARRELRLGGEGERLHRLIGQRRRSQLTSLKHQQVTERNGGVDGTRTRDPRRDRPVF